MIIPALSSRMKLVVLAALLTVLLIIFAPLATGFLRGGYVVEAIGRILSAK
jgi:hypothetical protein